MAGRKASAGSGQGHGDAVPGNVASGRAKALDELCKRTGWHSDHARRALRKVRAVIDAPAGKRLAPFLSEMVARLRTTCEQDL